MDRLGPFGPGPCVGVGVSGGADSSALALLARDWAAARHGSVLALVVDHGIRPESAAESVTTVARLERLGIPARRLVLEPPPRGPDISAAARAARHRMLGEACAKAGIAFLLLAHTRADQAETLLWRNVRGSGPHGAAGMAARRETWWGAVLRPLLDVAPETLRDTCRAAGLAWIDDPSNRDPAFARSRLRGWLADPHGEGCAIAALARTATRFGEARAADEAALAGELARLVAMRAEGFALIEAPAAMSPAGAQAVVRAVGGLEFPPDARAALALVRRGSGTLAGVQASPAGRLGSGILLAREPAALSAPMRLPAADAIWDRRWRVERITDTVGSVGALGGAAVPGRDRLPARLAAVLPAFRGKDGRLLAVPSLGWQADPTAPRIQVRFAPPVPLAGPPFLPSGLAAPGATAA